MKNFKSKQVFSLVISMFFVLTLNAQSDFRPGYIITLKGDTIKGLINYRNDISNAKSCIFKKEAEGEKITYLPEQIKSYRFVDGRYYVSGNSINHKFEQPVFLEYIIKGLVSIYFYADDTKDHYFAVKDTVVMELDHHERLTGNTEKDNVIFVKPEKFRGQLAYLMKDQPSLFAKINTIDCNKKSLTALTKQYQELSSPLQATCIQFEKKTTKDVVAKFGIFFSGGISNLSSPPYNINIIDYEVTKSLDFKTSFTYEIGAILDFSLNFIGEKKYFLQLAPSLNFVEYNSHVEHPLSPLLYIYKLNVKYTTLKIPLLFKYSFYNNKPVTPYIKFGLGCAMYLNENGIYNYSSVPLSGSNQENVYTKTLNHPSRPAVIYFVGGAGTDIKIGERMLFVGATYEYGEGQLKGFRSDAQLQVGFLF